MRGHDEAINSVTFSHDGKSILTGSNDKTAMLWDLQGKILQVFRGHKEGVWSVSFSPDDKNILTGSTDKNAKLWDLEGKVIQQFTGHEDVIWAAAFQTGKKFLQAQEIKLHACGTCKVMCFMYLKGMKEASIQ
jgi:WD40 repeat protein